MSPRPSQGHFLGMPRYFFNVQNVPPTTGNTGEELPDDEAAWREATLFAGDLLKDTDGNYRPGQEWGLEVTDAKKRPICNIRITSKHTV
jgi:hypothetical protein